MIKAILFDLDGTLLPMDENQFTISYFSLLYLICEKRYPDKKKLIETIYTGTKLMAKNDGSMTNEDVFWEYFKKVYGEEELSQRPMFDNFYKELFKKTKAYCGENKDAKKIVSLANKFFPFVILSTNPIFPFYGTKARMEFIDLEPDDFTYLTVYENCRYCKPNPQYFKYIIDRYALKPNECILFGNNVYEDGECASSLGIDTYIVTDNIIDPHNKKDEFKLIKREEMLKTLKQIIENNK